MKKTLSYLLFSATMCLLALGVNAQIISTIGGAGTAGFSGDGAPAVLGQLNGNFSIARDGSGNVYIAESANHRIRRIAYGSNVINTIAGTGTATYGGDGGAATAADLNTPTGVAVDAAGNIYICDQNNHRVRRINVSTGIITTVAGNGTAGATGDGGAATAARLNRPFAIAFDAAGNYYIADRNNSRIRRVNIATGIITTVAGTGTAGYNGDGISATTAQINFPQGITVGPSGNLYIADNGNNRIRMVDISTGLISTAAGNGGTGYAGDGVAATATGLNSPTAVAFDGSGNYYIADMNNHAVRMVNTGTGLITTTAGTGTSSYNGDCISPTAAQISLPSGFAFDFSGNLMISDRGNSRVRLITSPCSGTPMGGSITASVTDGCLSTTSLLTLVGASTGCDITYQWASSTDGSSFTNIAGATNSQYNTGSITSGTYYNVSVTCATSGSFFTGPSVFINVTSPIVLPAITGPSRVCDGASITLSISATSGTWSATNTNASVVATTGEVTGNIPGLDTINYNATNICGTTTASYVVTIDPILTPSVSVSASPGFTVCDGDVVTFTASPTFGGTAPAYQWYVNGVVAGTGLTFSYTPADNDIVRCIMTSNEACVSSPIGISDDTMNVVGLLTPSITIHTPYSDSVCTGSLLTYTATVVNGGSTPTYNWTVNGISYATTPTFIYVPLDGDLIQATLTSSFGCASPATVNSNTITMTVDATQTPAITISSSASAAGDTSCPADPVTFTAHSIYGGASPVFKWIKNGIAVATGPTFTYIPANGDSLQCRFFSSAVCRTVDSVVSNTIRMTILPFTPGSITSSVLPGTSITMGETVLLSAIATNAGSSPTFQWYVNGLPAAGATSAAYSTDSIADGDHIYCKVTPSSRCPLPSYLFTTTYIFNVGTGVREAAHTGTELNLVPNPTTGSFTIDGTMGTSEKDAYIQINNMVGRAVYNAQTQLVNGHINQQITLPAELANGIYILQVVSGGDKRIVRFSLSR